MGIWFVGGAARGGQDLAALPGGAYVRKEGDAERLKVKYTGFQTITRSRTLRTPVAGETKLSAISIDLVARLKPTKGVRLLDVTVSNLLAGQGGMGLRRSRALGFEYWCYRADATPGNGELC